MTTYTFAHVLISLAAIASGFVVAYGLVTGKRLDGWTLCFLAATAATSVTGFGFPFHGFTPAIGVGILSIAVLALAAAARYAFHLAGAWRWLYVVGAVIALYFNVFVLIVQVFQKAPAAKALAPTQTEPPFLIAQGATLALFVLLGVVAVRKFTPPPVFVEVVSP
jgi:hypothetical protein